MYEVLVELPGVLGVFSRCCCLMHRGGSDAQSKICELESRYMARGILILSGNQLLRHDLQLGIVLCQDHLVGAIFMCKQNDTIIFRNRRRFSEKPI